jgi:hypothetical protein
LVSEKIRREKVGQFLLFYLSLLGEQVRPAENVILVIVILLPVKYLLKPMVKTQWFP